MLEAYHDTNARCQIFYECHDSPSAGHVGIQKTYVLVHKQFYWPRLHKDVVDYVLHYLKCQVNKTKCLKVGGLLHPLEVPDGKWESISMDFITRLPTTNESISMDFITRLPTTNHGHDAIWVIVD